MSDFNITYRQIADKFQQACDEHIGISTFETGTIDWLDANAVNKTYPLIFLRPVGGGLGERVRTLSFELYSLDVPALQNQSPVDVLSDTETLIYDLMAWFNFNQASISQVYDITLTGLLPVNEAFQDRLYGWVASIDVTVPYKLDYCNYPTGSNG